MASEGSCCRAVRSLTVSLSRCEIFLSEDTKMAEGAQELVRFQNEGGIGVITVDNPPVNALSTGVPEGIVAALDQGNANPSVKAMVLIGAGRSFIAGADIRQFGKGPARPAPTRRHYDVMDDSPKP